MKKLFSYFIPILLFSGAFLSSCSKADTQEQLLSTTAREAGSDRNNCPPPPPPPPTCCPSVLPIATSISYSLNSFNSPQSVGILLDVFYTNPQAAGSFRVVLRNVNGVIDSVTVVPADLTGPGGPGMFHVDFYAPAEDFPCTVQVNGRPANLDCPGRTRRSFQIAMDEN